MPVPERGNETGSTLLLVPSAVLLLFLLTALSVDGAASFLAQRELADACAGAANDAAAVGLDVHQLYGPGGPSGQEVDQDRAIAVAKSRVAPLEARWGRAADLRVDVLGAQVVMHLAASVPLPIGPGGASRARTDVTATCRATTIRR